MELYRYPGAKPFSMDENALFFGRDQDIERLQKLISLEKMLVLHSKSGMGKSSLINAGIVPNIGEIGMARVFTIRFGPYVAGESLSPVQKMKQFLAVINSNFFDKIIRKENSVWYYLKKRQFRLNSNSFLLIFDQFEELFTYPESEIEEFKKELANISGPVIPQHFRKALETKLKQEEDFLADKEKKALFTPLNTRFLFSIRSDRMSLLNRLKDYFPNILSHCYELLPLTKEQAEDAILFPASLRFDEIDFKSPVFEYTDAAVNKIIVFLSSGQSKGIEAFQLQIICSHIESMVMLKGQDAKVVDAPKIEIGEGDLGDISDIYNNYYNNVISRLLPEERPLARIFIEEGLIFEEDQRRLSLYEGQIEKHYKVSKSLLGKLLDTHIIRSEPHPEGGYSFELSHDTLVAPILISKAERKEEEACILEKKKQEKILAEQKKQQKIENQRAKAKRIRVFAIIVGVLCGFAILLAFYANSQKQKAQIQQNIAVVNAQKAEQLKINANQQKELADSLRKQTEAFVDKLFKLGKFGIVISTDSRLDEALYEVKFTRKNTLYKPVLIKENRYFFTVLLIEDRKELFKRITEVQQEMTRFVIARYGEQANTNYFKPYLKWFNNIESSDSIPFDGQDFVHSFVSIPK